MAFIDKAAGRMSNISKQPLQHHLLLTMVMTILCALWLPGATSAQSGTRPKRSLVEVRTELGTMIIALFNETPAHRDKFLQHVEANAYDSLLFHRVVSGFGAEAGEPTSKYAKPGAYVETTPPEGPLPRNIVPGLIHKYGAISASPAGMENGMDTLSHDSRFLFVLGVKYEPGELGLVEERNAKRGKAFTYSEADREIYSSVGGAPRLDGGYTVFGEVVEGLDVLEALSNQTCDQWDRPLKDFRMFMRVLK